MDPYRAPDTDSGGAPAADAGGGDSARGAEAARESVAEPAPPPADRGSVDRGSVEAVTNGSGGAESVEGAPERGDPAPGNGHQPQWHGGHGGQQGHRGGRRGRRNRRGRHRGGEQPSGGGQGQPAPSGPPPVIVPDGTTEGWFDPSREAGFIRRAESSYLAEAGDAYVGPHLVRQYGLRRGDKIVAATGRDHRGRSTVAEITLLNDAPPEPGARRVDFQSLTASYPDRKLTLETGRNAKNGGPELTRRAIDLIAPIGYGQRALIVAPARAGKTMLLHAITEGIALNHPNAALLILLVDERPEEVSEAISWEVGEVVASSFDQPAKRHVEVVEMVLERARRLVEQGKDVVIVLDSLTRMARAFNTAERGTGRTLSGGLDSSAMARPKAFFGSARSIAPQHGGGSLTIIATALVETGSRMDDVIFEEFKGTGNCEIKLDRSLAEKRIFPAFDIATSGTRREEKLYREDQLQAIYMLRRGLQQMPPQTAMEWLIKRIAGTPTNDALLAGL
ncbi:MAG TPA: transcription termination factor Rho [Opitutus sp.]|nr:transcription termination factor Rho [Opitutus sp.]